jgi:Kef-type K+ transport system membrane component KefB
MNQQKTQFWVAIIGITGLVIIAGMAVAGSIWGDAPTEMAFMLVGGLLSATSTAIAWLFRLNGKAG